MWALEAVNTNQHLEVVSIVSEMTVLLFFFLPPLIPVPQNEKNQAQLVSLEKSEKMTK